MKITRIQIPKDQIKSIHESIDDNGGPLAELNNGLYTDIYQDSNNNFWSITNDSRIINHLKYNSLEMEFKDLLLKVTDSKIDANKHVSLKINIFYKNQFRTQLEIYFNFKDKIAINSFDNYEHSSINFKEHKLIDDLCNYFLKDIEDIETIMYSTKTDEASLIKNLKKLGYANKIGYINANDDLKLGEYLLEKKI